MKKNTIPSRSCLSLRIRDVFQNHAVQGHFRDGDSAVWAGMSLGPWGKGEALEPVGHLSLQLELLVHLLFDRLQLDGKPVKVRNDDFISHYHFINSHHSAVWEKGHKMWERACFSVKHCRLGEGPSRRSRCLFIAKVNLATKGVHFGEFSSHSFESFSHKPLQDIYGLDRKSNPFLSNHTVHRN